MSETRNQFKKLRRDFRIAHKGNIMEQANMDARFATHKALIDFVGKLEDCRPLSQTFTRSTMWRGKTGRYVPVVHRAQAVWMRNMARLDEAEALVSQARTRVVNGVRWSA